MENLLLIFLYNIFAATVVLLDCGLVVIFNIIYMFTAINCMVACKTIKCCSWSVIKKILLFHFAKIYMAAENMNVLDIKDTN